MRSIIVISLVTLLGVGGAGYSMAWFSQSKAAKSAIEQEIARINGTQKYLTYESIESSGFPFALKVVVTKPHFNGRVDQMLKALETADNGGTPPATSAFATLPTWNEDIALDGNVAFGINAMSSQYSVTFSGNITQVATLAGKTLRMEHKQSGDSYCGLHMQRGFSSVFTDMWDFKALADYKEQFFQDLRMFDCSYPVTVSTNLDTKAVLASSGAGRFYVTHTPTTDRKIRIYASMPDIQVTADGDAMYNFYRSALLNFPSGTKLSNYGKQNLNLDIAYTGPLEIADNGPMPPLDITGSFNLANQAYSQQFTLYFNNAITGENRKLRASLKGESSFTAQYDILIRDALRELIVQLYNSRDPSLKDIQDKIKNYNTDQIYAIVHPAVPNFAALGKLVDSFDFNFAGSPDMKTGEMSLAGLELSVTPYGITANGSAKLAANTTPNGQLSMACRECIVMIDDMANYAARVQHALSYFNPQQPAGAWLDERLVTGLKTFLSALATVSENNTLNYVIVSDPTTGVTVNGYPMEQVMGLYQKTLAPALTPAETKLTR